MNHSGSHPQLFERSIDHKQSLPTSISTAAISSSAHPFHSNNHQDKKPGASQRSSKSKVFQCTGFGDCKMVFTRSEHLARHMRKHTGEKPFKCIVPGCERMFSRFDNMMQHTQTHNKGRPRRGNKAGRSKRGNRKSANSSRRDLSSDEYDEDFDTLPSPPPSRKSSMGNILEEQQKQPFSSGMRRSQFDYEEEDMDDATTSDEDPSYHPPGSYQHHRHHPHHPTYPSYPSSSIYGQPRILNPPLGYYQQQLPPPPPPPSYNNLSSSRFPDSPASSSDSSSARAPNLNDYLPAPYRRRSAPQIHYQPYPYDKHQHQQSKEALPSIPRKSSVLSQLANYLVNHPDKSPESYLTEHHREQQHEQVVQQHPPQQQQPLPPSPSSSSQSLSDNLPTRRLSIHDLSNPIDTLNDEENERTSSSNSNNNNNSSSDGTAAGSDENSSNQSASTTAVEDDDDDAETVQLTEDEYQAIKGFAQFRSSAVICKK